VGYLVDVAGRLGMLTTPQATDLAALSSQIVRSLQKLITALADRGERNKESEACWSP
jgi:hypothetical protein